MRFIPQLFSRVENGEDLSLFEAGGRRTAQKQQCHTLEAVKLVEHNLKSTLTRLVTSLFGKGEHSRCWVWLVVWWVGGPVG